jgi:NAD(P)-dependent dehydrogenase (short-subunit alcohol dehydrogenase family)
MSDTSPKAFAGKIGLVTGGAQGIGEAVARRLAAEGASGVALVDRRRDKGEAVAASLTAAGTPAIFIHADLTEAAEVATIVPAVDKAFGRLDFVANVAGLTDRGSILDTDLTLFDRMFAVNVRAPFFIMQDAIKLMQRERIEGAIVNVSSVNAHVGAPQLAAYSASKAALVNLSKNTANSVNGLRIRVNCILPGWVDTPGEHETLTRWHDAPADWLEQAEKGRPFGRLLKADDIARGIIFLGGPASYPMTGSVLDFEQTVFGGFGGMDGYPEAK